MNRWTEANIEANPDSKVMLEGNPFNSSYLWVAFLITITAFITLVKVASQIYGNHQEIMQWAPILVGAVVAVVIAANQAILALRDARLESITGRCSRVVERRAFQKFRTYSLFTLVVVIGLGVLGLNL